MKTALAILCCLLALPARAQDEAPLPMEAGQAAPSAGVFLTTERAGRLYLECQTAKTNAAEFEKALKAQPDEPMPVRTLLVAGGVGVVIGVVATFLVLKLGGK